MEPTRQARPRSEWEAWEAEKRNRQAMRFAGCMAIIAVASLVSFATLLVLVITNAV
jgi:hypothetical protein